MCVCMCTIIRRATVLTSTPAMEKEMELVIGSNETSRSTVEGRLVSFKNCTRSFAL